MLNVMSLRAARKDELAPRGLLSENSSALTDGLAVPQRAHRVSENAHHQQGAYIPFPRTRAEREKTGDPGVSIEERYPSRAEYLARIEQVAKGLASERYILAGDVPAIVAEAGRHWGWRMTEAK